MTDSWWLEWREGSNLRRVEIERRLVIGGRVSAT